MKLEKQKRIALGNYIEAKHLVLSYYDMLDQVDVISGDIDISTEDKALAISPYMKLIRLIEKAGKDLTPEEFFIIYAALRNEKKLNEQTEIKKEKFIETVSKELVKMKKEAYERYLLFSEEDIS